MLRACAVLAVALAAVTCRDAVGPQTTTRARIAVAPVLPSEAALADFGLTIDAVRFIVVRPAADTLADTTLALPPDSTELALDLRVIVVSVPETLQVSVVALSGTLPLFIGTQPVPVPSTVVTEIPVDSFVGPVADSIVIQPRAPFITLNDSLRFQVQGFNQGVPVTQFYIAWSSSDSSLAPINTFGVLRAPGARASVRVRARTPTGATDSVIATFAPPATQLVLIAGGGQADTVGTPLATPLEVEARAADGVGVGGVSVRFRGVAGGGAVADSLVVTDAAGRARTSATLGGGLGPQSFEASVTGLAGSPVTFNATALAGSPTQLLAAAGDGQVTTVATHASTRPAVVLRDAGGNPVAGASVTFTVASGGGGVTGGSQSTDASGNATVGDWTLGTLAGTNTLTASAAGLTRNFTATGVAGSATQLVASGGDLQSAVVGSAVATDPAVRAQDQFGNPVAGASISFSVSGGGGNVTGAAPLTNAAGTATVGSWTLGTTVGGNTLTATLSGLTPVTFTATATAGAATQIQAIAGGGQTVTVNTLVTTAPAARVTDQFGNPVPGAPVTFAVGSGGGSIGGPGSVTTDTSGTARSPAWTIGTLVGPNTLTATASGLAGSPVTFTATGAAAAASQMVAHAGDGQAALVSSAVSTAPAVRVADPFGNPVAGVGVTFAVATGGGTLGGPGGAVTDTGGVATCPAWILGSVAGTNTLDATAIGLPKVTFTAQGLASAATTIVLNGGNGQSAVVGTALAAYSVLVTDGASPVANVPVTWAVTSGGGSIVPPQSMTNAAGIATATQTLGTIAGTQTATASVGGLSGSPVVFNATGLAGAPTQLVIRNGDNQSAIVGTAVAIKPSVILMDQFNNPVPGVSVTFAVTGGGGGVTGATPTTDGQGVATVGGWTLGSVAGLNGNTLRATASGLPGSAMFIASGVAGPAVRLAFVTDPGRALAGDTIEPAVRVAIQDQFGNTVLPAKDVVTLRLGATPDPAGKLLGTVDAAAFNGVVVFPTLAIDSAGIGYTLVATAVNLTDAESKPFDVGGVIAAVQDDRLDPVSAAFSTATGLVYIPGVNNAIGVFDPSKGLISSFPILQNQPFGVAVNALTNRVYVTTFGTLVGSVMVLDGRDPSAILSVIPIVGEPRGIAADEATDRVFVAVGGDPGRGTPPSLAIIDGKDNRVVVSIPFPEGALAGIGVAFNPNDRLVYVAIPNVGVGIFDPEGNRFVRAISIVGEKGAAGTFGVAMDVRTNLLYATNRADNSVSVIEVSTSKERQRLRVGLLPEGLGVDSDRGAVYVGNSGENTVSFIDVGKLEVIATLIVGPAPKAAAVNPGTGQFYVPTFLDDRVRVVQP